MDPFIKAFEQREFIGWSEPDLRYLDQNEDVPFRAVALFGPLYPYVEALAADCSAPVDYVAHALLGAVGSILSGRIRVRPFANLSWSVTPVLWIGLVGDPSTRKTPAFENVLKPLYRLQEKLTAAYKNQRREHEDALIYNEVASKAYENDVRAAARQGEPIPNRPVGAAPLNAPRCRRLFVGDITVEAMGDILADNPEGTLCKRNELAGWYDTIDRYHSGSKPFWIEAYDGGPHVIDRRSREEPLLLPAVCVSILGTIQPDLVDKILNDPKDGAAARILFVWPKPTPFSVPETAVDHSRLFGIYQRLEAIDFIELGDGRPQPREVTLEPTAANRFEHWVKEIEKNAASAHGHHAAFLGKAAGTVLRVAVISEFLKAADASAKMPSAISLDTLEATIEWMDTYARPMALKVYGHHGQSLAERDARILLAYLKVRDLRVFNTRELMRASGKDRLGTMNTASEMEAAITLLIAGGWVRKMEGTGRGIRPRQDYAVHPRLLEAKPYLRPCGQKSTIAVST